MTTADLLRLLSQGAILRQYAANQWWVYDKQDGWKSKHIKAFAVITLRRQGCIKNDGGNEWVISDAGRKAAEGLGAK